MVFIYSSYPPWHSDRMKDNPILTLRRKDFPALLREIPDAPTQLYMRGTLPDEQSVWLCVVGSRAYSPYGASVCRKLIQELAGYPVVIVSGLALGIDSIAHEAALATGLKTVAVPGSPITDERLYPRAHLGLAHAICGAGGALISELSNDDAGGAWVFARRNRIMAGMCHATLIIEAREKSGTCITARLAMEYNRDVLVVPGAIYSAQHAGSNQLLRNGAQAVTCGADILQALAIPIRESAVAPIPDTVSPEERAVLEAVAEPATADEIARVTGLSITQLNIIISMLELKRLVAVRLGKIERYV